MYRGMKKHTQALLLGALLGACGAPIEPETALEPAAEQPFGRVRAAVSAATPETLSLDLRNDTARVFPADRLPINGDADFIDNQDNNLLVQQNNSEVFVTYMSTSAQFNSTLAYFTYPDGSPPTTAPTLTQSNVVFPSSQNLTAGTRVSLGVFNAGTRVGLVLLPGAGASNPPNLSGTKYYSVNSLNGGGGAYFTAKYHKAEQRRVIGIEDSPVGSSSHDLNDLIISVSSSPKEKPRKLTICSYSFPNLSSGWQHRTWVPSDCSAGLPPANAIALGSPQTWNGDPDQQAHCTYQTGSHYFVGGGLTYANVPYGPWTTYGSVTCAFLIPGETSDIRTCSYRWQDHSSGVVRSRTWQASDCPQGLPEQGSWAVGEGQNDGGSSGQVNCELASGHHYNHPYVDGATSGTVKCMFVKPTQNNDNITVCRKQWSDYATGWRRHTWTAADCSNGLPKPGAVSITHPYNGNGTRGVGLCYPQGGEHYNHPDISGATMGVVTCLFVNP